MTKQKTFGSLAKPSDIRVSKQQRDTQRAQEQNSRGRSTARLRSDTEQAHSELNRALWRGEPDSFLSSTPPTIVLTNESGLIRVAIWKNVHFSGKWWRYSVQPTNMYFAFKERRLRYKRGYKVSDLIMMTKLMMRAIQWICEDSRQPWPTELSDFSDVGFEVRLKGRNKPVIVRAEEQVERLIADWASTEGNLELAEYMASEVEVDVYQHKRGDKE